jgi:drug/metabolite transporter superfamily protein YnfA
MSTSQHERPPSTFRIAAKYGGALAVAAYLWLKLVNREVVGVYLVSALHL